jgi:hypothetical protein
MGNRSGSACAVDHPSGIFGALDVVPRLAVPLGAVEIASIERAKRPLAAFLLAQVDGRTSIRTLVDLVTAPQKDVLALLRRWFEAGVLVPSAASTSPPPSGRRLKSTTPLGSMARPRVRATELPTSVVEQLGGRLILWRGSRWKLR